jgi:hypothetical protein
MPRQLALNFLLFNVYFQGVKQVLVKLGAKGSALFIEGEKPIKQTIISAARVLDTTGAGDTFTAAFAVALVEGKTKEECMRFAGMTGVRRFCLYFIHLYIIFHLNDALTIPLNIYSCSSFSLCSSEGSHP